MAASGLPYKFDDDTSKLIGGNATSKFNRLNSNNSPSESTASILAPGDNVTVTSGRRRFMRNDFMGNAYNEAVDNVKKELT